MDSTALVAFAAFAAVMIAVPGPDWAYVLAAGPRERGVVPVVAGILLGYVLITSVVVTGLGSLVAAAPAALLALTLAGGAYLTYLGVKTLRGSGTLPTAVPTADGPSTRWRSVLGGVGVSALNPKGLLIFLAVLPQFARADAAWPLAAQLAALGAVYIAICASFYLPLGYAAGLVLRAKPGVASLTTRIAGVAMVVVGVGLLGERIYKLVSA